MVGGSNLELVYMIAWDSMADRDQKWTASMADPEWLAAKAKSEENGPIVRSTRNAFLQPTKFSTVK